MRKRLKSTRTRLKRRTVVVLALATAGALAVAGVAVGAGNSTATINFTPVNLANPGFTDGKLFVKTTTAYTNPGNQNPGGATERAQLYFDDDIRVNTNAAPKCDPNDISSATTTLAQAQAACGPSLVGSGTAKAIFDPPPPGGPTNVVNGCVRIYNGQGTTSEVLIFTRVQVGVPPNNTISCTTNGSQGNVTVLLPGDLKAAGNVPGTGDADFQDPDNCSAPVRLGCQLDVNNITDHAALPLSEFNVSAQKVVSGTANDFTQGRCKDTGEPTASRLDMRTRFTYNDATGQTKNGAADCT